MGRGARGIKGEDGGEAVLGGGVLLLPVIERQADDRALPQPYRKACRAVW
jgi:hypothetical protein